MAAVNIELEGQEIEDLFADALKNSAIAQVAVVDDLATPRDAYTFYWTDGTVKVHGPESAGNKTETGGALAKTKIILETFYTMLKFHDKQYDDTVGAKIVDSINARQGLKIAESFDRAAFGPEALEDSPFGGFTEASVTVDGTADSWINALTVLETKKQTPTAFILDHSFKGAVRKAFTEGSIVNPLTFGVQDGFTISGVPVYFRDLGADAEGNAFGAVGDWSKFVLATFKGLTSEIYIPGESLTARIENKITVYNGWVAGVGVATQKAILPLVLADAPVAGSAVDPEV